MSLHTTWQLARPKLIWRWPIFYSAARDGSHELPVPADPLPFPYLGCPLLSRLVMELAHKGRTPPLQQVAAKTFTYDRCCGKRPATYGKLLTTPQAAHPVAHVECTMLASWFRHAP